MMIVSDIFIIKYMNKFVNNHDDDNNHKNNITYYRHNLISPSLPQDIINL